MWQHRRMHSPTLASQAPLPPLRPLGRRAQLMARGPGWRLREGEAGAWQLRVRDSAEDQALTWSQLAVTLRSLADDHGPRALFLDLSEAPRLSAAAAEILAELLAELEARRLRVSVFIARDAIQSVRLHRLISIHAPTVARCAMDQDESLHWLRRGALLPPLRRAC